MLSVLAILSLLSGATQLASQSPMRRPGRRGECPEWETTMKVQHSMNSTPVARDTEVGGVLREVTPGNLRASVEMLAFPRHYSREKRANRKARDLLVKHARSLGYTPSLQGRFDNVVIATPAAAEEP